MKCTSSDRSAPECKMADGCICSGALNNKIANQCDSYRFLAAWNDNDLLEIQASALDFKTDGYFQTISAGLNGHHFCWIKWP